ncbi:Hpt domain-containing protein [Hydrogenimonas sp.]
MGIKKRLEEEYDYEVVDEFIDHFDIMTEVMEPTIIALDASFVEKERIDELFRIFHNIKSATSYLKIERIYLLAELAEEEMERIRSNPASVDENVIDWLLLVSDQMRKWYKELMADEDLTPIDPKILNLPEY